MDLTCSFHVAKITKQALITGRFITYYYDYMVKKETKIGIIS